MKVKKYQKGGPKRGSSKSKKSSNKPNKPVDLRWSTVNKEGKVGPRYTKTKRGLDVRDNAGSVITYTPDSPIYKKFFKEGPPKMNPDIHRAQNRVNKPAKKSLPAKALSGAKKGLNKLKNAAAEVKYQLFDKGTIRDWKWQESDRAGFHWNMIRKGRDYDGGNTRKQHGGPVFNEKGMKVPGMRQDGGSMFVRDMDNQYQKGGGSRIRKILPRNNKLEQAKQKPGGLTGRDKRLLDDYMEKKVAREIREPGKQYNRNFKSDVSNMTEMWKRTSNPYKNVWDKRKPSSSINWEIKGNLKDKKGKHLRSGGAVGSNGVL
tara:strand:+ start:7392 stop:8342 length:951 start_codon:yes stop_codon:yes gene_type:complete